AQAGRASGEYWRGRSMTAERSQASTLSAVTDRRYSSDPSLPKLRRIRCAATLTVGKADGHGVNHAVIALHVEQLLKNKRTAESGGSAALIPPIKVRLHAPAESNALGT